MVKSYLDPLLRVNLTKTHQNNTRKVFPAFVYGSCHTPTGPAGCSS